MSEVRVLYGQTERVCAFVSERLKYDRSLTFGECQAIGFEIDNNLVGGAVFQNYDPIAATMEISAGATDPRWMARKSLQHIFGYVFDTAGCQLCILKVSEDNERMRSIARRLGFAEYLIPRVFGPQTAGAIYTLTAEQWAGSRIRSSRSGKTKGPKAA